MKLLCSWMCRAHCHRVIKLSGTLGQVAPEKELAENVHGVRETFLDVGKEVRHRLQSTNVAKNDPVFAPDAKPTLYFIGKMLWSKGLGSLMELLKYVEESADLKVKMDMYGGGPDMEAADAKAKTLGLDFEFHGPLDHSEIAYTHKIFINPSTSEVLCTTSAESLAMGKFVILPSHPSNDFFAQFPNCLTYSTKDEFVGNLFYAMTHSPEPLSEAYLYALSWEAATERLVAASAIPVAEAELMQQALSSKEAGIEIALPPLVESEEGRKLISQTFRDARERYRTFRSRLSAEVLQNRVLPAALKDRLATELDKRLDIDIDEILEKPKLRLQLSPAELDKTLLELYDNVSAGATGDALRVIGGGGQVAFQTMYMRQQAKKQQQRAGTWPDLIPFYLDEVLEDEDDIEGPAGVQTVAQRVRSTLRKNLPRSRSPPAPRPTATTKNQEERTPPLYAATAVPSGTSSSSSAPNSGENSSSSSSSSTRDVPRMSITSCYSTAAVSASERVNHRPCTWSGLVTPSSLARLSATSSSLRLSRSVSVLI
jgi:Glycosyl transferases group 1